jgi:hypothetical protein
LQRFGLASLGDLTSASFLDAAGEPRQGTVETGEFLHKLEIPEFHHEAALVDVEETVDFRIPLTGRRRVFAMAWEVTSELPHV